MAVLVSVLVHGCVALVLLGQAGRTADAGSHAAPAGHSLTVRLVAQAAAGPVASPDLPPPAASAPAEAGLAKSALPVVDGIQGVMRPEPHYFEADVTTKRPAAFMGLAYGRLLVVPGLSEQEVTLEVWISDEGNIDRVELESSLTPEQQQLLLAEFAKVRFRPARIGRIAVHSRMTMRILVDYTVRA
jgi:hypothetical protein